MPNANHCRDEDGRDAGAPGSDSEHDRPKYMQVRDALVERIRSGTWKPGDVIPSEQEIAREFDVASGTARKAILILVEELGLLTRRQGSGTWVQDAAPYRFFSFFDDGNVRVAPDSRDFTSTLARANKQERSLLKLQDDALVVRISRTRTRAGKPFIAEMLSVPEALFQNLASEKQLPDVLYVHYQQAYKVLVTSVEDRVSAVAANATTATRLRVKIGTPLLKVDRIAYAPDKQPVEWRVSLCQLKNAHYLVRMGA
jgi:GntR family transcriptional regulator